MLLSEFNVSDRNWLLGWDGYLLAEMNSRYKSLLARSIEIHKFQWLSLVLECSAASVLPAPPGAIENVFFFLFPAMASHSTVSCPAVSKIWTSPSSTGLDSTPDPRSHFC